MGRVRATGEGRSGLVGRGWYKGGGGRDVVSVLRNLFHFVSPFIPLPLPPSLGILAGYTPHLDIHSYRTLLLCLHGVAQR